MPRILIVANQTLGGDHLAKVVRDRLSQGPTEFSLLVPATRSTDIVIALAEAFAVQGGVRPPPGTDEDFDAANRVQVGLAWLLKLGVSAKGFVAEHDPVPAVRDFVAQRGCDEIIVSTLPHGFSSWLHHDLPHRLERATGLPVTVVSAPHPVDE